MDFTLRVYKELIQAVRFAGYEFQTFEQFLLKPLPRAVILRNDVDRKPARALQVAQILSGQEVQATFYFRIAECSWAELLMAEIVRLGHELGYHYEDLFLARGKNDLAIKTFEVNLEKFRKLYQVQTICMHGSPLSSWDNRSLWQKWNYRDFGIIGEPYFDLDFNRVLYLTDSGRCWNGDKTIVRDKVPSNFKYNLRTTFDLIRAFREKALPDQIMITIHPQRWNDDLLPWLYEFTGQKMKNIVKKYVLVKRAG
jgi:hypothetical protein